MIESSKMGITRMAAFYMLCGGIASLFSALISSNLSCGNFSSIMAMVSGLLALVIRNWTALKGAGPLRIILLFVIIFLFIIFLLLTASTQDAGPEFMGIDFAGEGGGFMAGLWLGMVLMPAVRRGADRPGSFENLIMKIGGAISFIYVLLITLLFIFIADPKRTIYSV